MKVDRHGQAKVLTPDEVARLFEVMTCDRDRALFSICLYTGSRINEACTLLSKDIYDSTGIRSKLTIRKENTKGEQNTRQIPLNEKLSDILAAYQPEAGKTHLFPGRHGHGHINPRSADAILREACDRAGIDGVSTHSFRRTALTKLSASGIPLRVIQQISGHRSLQALQRYLEVSEEQVEEAVAAIVF